MHGVQNISDSSFELYSIVFVTELLSHKYHHIEDMQIYFVSSLLHSDGISKMKSMDTILSSSPIPFNVIVVDIYTYEFGKILNIDLRY